MRKLGLFLWAVGWWLLSSGSVGAQTGGEVVGAADLGPEGTASTATFYDLGSAGTRVVVILQGATPGSRQALHIHTDGCAGTILYPLTTVAADAQGTVESETVVPGKVEFGRWYVDVHSADTANSPAAGCGQVNPALAGAPPSGSGTPGMPTTGQESFPGIMLLVLGLGVGAGALLAGYVFRKRGLMPK